MARGKTRGEYVTDGGTSYEYNVNQDRFADGSFGWGAATAIMNKVPRGAKLRHVTGVSATTGRRATGVVPVVTADVWTGGATTFDVIGNDGSTDTMTIVQRIGEKPVMS